MSQNWKKVLGTVAPWIGAAAAGGVPALVGMAASQVSSAFGKEVKGTVDAVAQAIAGATPEQMLALKSADQEFQKTMQQLGFENLQLLENIAAEDRDSARTMHTAVRDLSTPILSYLVVAAFFSTIYLLFVVDVKLQAELRDVAMVLLGTLAASYTQVMNFRFGTSAGSRAKTDLLSARRLPE
jgi:hypothetical protein